MKNKELNSIELRHIKDFLIEKFKNINVDVFLPADMTSDIKSMIADLKSMTVDIKSVPYPEFNLFLWCILSNRIEAAMFFWKLGKVKEFIQS
jgi:hypothetical protein